MALAGSNHRAPQATFARSAVASGQWPRLTKPGAIPLPHAFASTGCVPMRAPGSVHNLRRRVLASAVAFTAFATLLASLGL